MKLETTIHKLLTNKIVLYIVSIVAVLNILGYLSYGNMNAVLYFVILAGLVYYFSKNMIIVLLVPLILVNLWAGSQYQISKVEGMGTLSESEESSTSVAMPAKTAETTETASETTSSPPVEENAPSGSESFKGAKKSNHKLDYSGTLSDTYNHLNEILGSEGMKALTNDTKQLMEQQKQLAESMKGLEPILNSFGPLMKQAEGLLGGMNGSGGLNEIMKKFGNSGSKE